MKLNSAMQIIFGNLVARLTFLPSHIALPLPEVMQRNETVAGSTNKVRNISETDILYTFESRQEK